MPKVSLIVPVYNSRATLKACLDSLVGQTLDEVEIVAVDDHSSDGSLAVLQEYADSYRGAKRLVIAQTKTGKGPGAARNTGLGLASGEYVGFVDSDDTVDADFCKSLHDAAKAVDADLSFCDISFDYPDGSSKTKCNPGVQDGSFCPAAKRSYLRRYTSYFTTYLYRKAMLDGYSISFPPTRSAEDSCFLACCLLCTERIARVQGAKYHYVMGASSTSHRKDPKRFLQKLESFRLLRQFAKEHGLYRKYCGIIEFVIFKKGTLGALRELLTNLTITRPA